MCNVGHVCGLCLRFVSPLARACVLVWAQSAEVSVPPDRLAPGSGYLVSASGRQLGAGLSTAQMSLMSHTLYERHLWTVLSDVNLWLVVGVLSMCAVC